MKDRLDRRKYGLLCKDDTSNYDYIYSYINKLQCSVVDMSCYKSWKPCKKSREEIIAPCEIDVDIEIEIDQNDDRFYTVTVTATNTFGNVTYNWTYDNTVWSDVGISQNVFEGSADSDFVLTTTDLVVLVTDERGCQGTVTQEVTFKGGCTDPNANNYDPEATYDTGTCLYDPVVLVMNYVCNLDTSGTISVTVTGGVGPYTIIGTQDNTILANGSSYGGYAIDSLGNISNTVTDTINCPFDCGTVTIDPGASVSCDTDENGFNTGTGTLTINPSGGTPPYVITGGTDGQTVNDEDNLNITVTDANGCVGNANIVVDCEPFVPPVDITCEEVSFDFDASLVAQGLNGTDILVLGLNCNLYNLTPGVVIQDYDFVVTNNLSPAPVIQCLALTPGSSSCSCNNCGGTTGSPFFGNFELNYASPPYEQDYSLLVEISIRLQVTSGTCEFTYSQTFEDVLPEEGIGTLIGAILQTKTQSF